MQFTKLLATILLANLISFNCAFADELNLPAKKDINANALAAYKKIPVTVSWQGKKSKYDAVPLRALFQEMMPSVPIETMPDWKALSRLELVMEVKGSDGYPGLVTATELAINVAGDKFVLVTRKNDKTGNDEVDLICKSDDERVRWVRDVASLRVLSLASH